jgi:hypothetical protein
MCCESPSRVLVGALLLAALTLPACGKKGDPLPPERLVPATTTHLTVAQRGREIVIAFPYPNATAAGTALPGLEQISLWQLSLSPPPGPAGVAAPPVAPPDLRLFNVQAVAIERLDAAGIGSSVQGDRIVLRRNLPAPPDDGNRQVLVLAIKTRAQGGEESAFSNLGLIEVLAPPPAPRGLAAEGEAEGVRVSWDVPGAPGEASWVGFNLYRREATSKVYGAPIATLTTEREFLDRGAPLGSQLIYAVTTVAARQPIQIESGIEAEKEVHHRDLYPPPGPRGLVALAETGRVRLIWDPVSATDLAGYLVYRRDPGSEDFVKIAGPVEKPEFEQTDLPAGETFVYRVTAVDRAGNESEPSGPAAGRVR